jgi:hypothetical protein
MPTSPGQVRTWTARPLHADEWAEAQRVAERIHADFGHLIAMLPEHARHASGLSRHLGVLRVTCQRLVQALTEQSSPLMLSRLPGIDALRQVLEGMKRVGCDESDIEQAQSAVEAFANLITTLAGSQTRLTERLNISTSGTANGNGHAPGDDASREQVFRAASTLTGRSCDLSLSVYAFRVAPDDPTQLERALTKGLIGSMMTPGGLPMILSSGDTVKTAEEVRRLMSVKEGGELRGRTPEAILKPFTSDPLPMVTSRSRKGKLYQVIDAAKAGPEPLDVVTALKARHPLMDPATGRTTLDAVWSIVNCPAAKLIFDVYLHQDMERWYRPSIDALLWVPDLNIDEDDKWIMRVPSGPKMQLLGRGLANAGSPLWHRHGELSAYFFDYLGWNPEEFVGFRCEVQYPVWRAGYCMAMEWLRDQPGG